MDWDSYRPFSEFLIAKDRELQKNNHVAYMNHPEHVGSCCSVVEKNPFVEEKERIK